MAINLLAAAQYEIQLGEAQKSQVYGAKASAHRKPHPLAANLVLSRHALQQGSELTTPLN